MKGRYETRHNEIAVGYNTANIALREEIIAQPSLAPQTTT